MGSALIFLRFIVSIWQTALSKVKIGVLFNADPKKYHSDIANELFRTYSVYRQKSICRYSFEYFVVIAYIDKRELDIPENL